MANQLLFTYLLVITISLFAVSSWALFMIKSESITDLRNSLEVDAVNLSFDIDSDLPLDSVESRSRIKMAVDRHAAKQNVYVTVVNKDGHILADSGTGPTSSSQRSSESGENISNQPEINDALAGIIGIYERNSSITNSKWLFFSYPVRNSGRTTGVIRVAVPLRDIERRLNEDFYSFIRIILATALVTIWISLWLAKRVNRPVKEMSAMAKNIALSGDMSEFVPVSRRDEIGELGLSFNQMIGRLREQERLRQEFIANASHELKTPTMAIGSVVEALQAGAVHDPNLRDQFLGSLEKLVDRQTSLLHDLLDISRLDGGLETVWQDDVNISQIIADAVEQVRLHADKRQVNLTAVNSVQGYAEAEKIPGNSIQLQRAIVNILTNAVNYTPAGGHVTLSAKLPGANILEVKVQDTGSGIEPADLPHIFERFYRADKSRTRTSGGSGLGLAITREIIARHHGTITVESTVGKGTTFSIHLPTGKEGANV